MRRSLAVTTTAHAFLAVTTTAHAFTRPSVQTRAAPRLRSAPPGDIDWPTFPVFDPRGDPLPFPIPFDDARDVRVELAAS